MFWAGLKSAAELSERMDGAMTAPTLNNRIQGNHELKPIEVEPIARALGVHPDVMRPDGPELPDPEEHIHLSAMVTGRPGAWTVTVMAEGEVPQEVRYRTEDAPHLAGLFTGAADDDLPPRPTTGR